MDDLQQTLAGESKLDSKVGLLHSQPPCLPPTPIPHPNPPPPTPPEMKSRTSPSHFHKIFANSPCVVPLLPLVLLRSSRQTSNTDPQWLPDGFFLTNKVKGKRLALISTLTGASVWPLLFLLGALHLSHADLSCSFFLRGGGAVTLRPPLEALW